MTPAQQIAHAGQLADELALHLGRTAFPRAPERTNQPAANDAHYGEEMRAWAITHQRANGLAHTVHVIAPTPVSAEIYALDTLPEIGAQA